MKNTRKQYLDSYAISLKYARQGHKLQYLRPVLFPVLEICARFLERSREEMGEIERTLLQLVKAGVGQTGSLARLTGFNPQRISVLLKELLGRGLLDLQSHDSSDAPVIYTLSELGALSVEQGREVLYTERSLLMCGLTGRLLPRGFYDLPRYKPDSLKRMTWSKDIIYPEDELPQKYLDIDQYPNRRQMNIVDEAIEITTIVEKHPMFVEGMLVHLQNNSGKYLVEVLFNRVSIDWLSAGQIQKLSPVIEPLGFNTNDTVDDLLRKIEQIVTMMGCRVDGLERDVAFLTPHVRVSKLSDAFLASKYRDNPLAYFVGTDRFPPVGIGTFPWKSFRGLEKTYDLLHGRCMYIEASEKSLKQEIDMLRFMEETVSGFYGQNWRKRSVSKETYFLQQLEDENIELDRAGELAAAVGDNRITSLIRSIKECYRP